MISLTDVTSGLNYEQEGITMTIDKDRHLQLDVDGTCYHVAKADIRLETNINNLLHYVEQLRQCAGAGLVFTHTTLKLKGGREQMATVQPYQEKRHGYHNPVYLARVGELRRALIPVETATIKPAPQLFIEADDSMTMAHHKRILETGDPTLSVIGTDDKDLGHNPGNIINISSKKTIWSGEWCKVTKSWIDNMGWVAFRPADGAKNKKLVGRGMRFFWAQMLAGDSADNIAGLPAAAGWVADIWKPLKKGYREGQCAVGESLAAEIISQQATEVDCFRTVYQAYASYYGDAAMYYVFESAFLLWMRKTNNPLDVLDYFKSLGVDYQLHPNQIAALHEYHKQCNITLQEGIEKWIL